MDTPDKVTINDIARLSGLSKGTVDRVLHNRGEVSKKSKAKVMAVIEELGYHPNVIASLLARKQEHLIGVLLPRPEPGSYWELAAMGMKETSPASGTLGIRAELFTYDQYDEDSFRNAGSALLEKNPSGAVIAPMYKEETLAFAARLQERGIPYAFVDTKLETPDYLAYFGIPTYQSGYLSADMLTGGEPVREVLVVRILRDKKKQSDPTVLRRSGFMDYISEHCPGCTVRSLFIDPSDPAATDGILEAFFEEFPQVRHIVMFNSRIHLIVPFLERHPAKGRHVIGFDNLESNLSALRRGTVNMLIAQHPDIQVARAIEVLADSIVLGRAPSRRDNYMHMDLLTRYNAEDY